MQAEPKSSTIVEASTIVEDMLPLPPPMEPVGVVFRSPTIRYAGWWRRVGAAVIDYMVVGVGLMFGSAVLGGAGGSVGFAVVVFLLMFFGVAAYFIFLNMNGEATIGKRVLGVRVQLEDGGNLGLGVATLRLLASPLSWLWMLGVLWPLWDQKKQSFHDKIALTVVVKT